MPVRIYDIAKRLGIESKEVLAKAKALGISAAKVPSSSLDKITAEYLEEQLGGRKPVAVAQPPPAPAPPEPILIVSAPPDTPTLAAPALPADTNLQVDATGPIAEAPEAPPLAATAVEAKAASASAAAAIVDFFIFCVFLLLLACSRHFCRLRTRPETSQALGRRRPGLGRSACGRSTADRWAI